MILADEVGLGKTIEAGLILKELRARDVLDRVLIISPANLVTQWQHELAAKFNESFVYASSEWLRNTSQGRGAEYNPWTSGSNLICSMQFVRRDEQRELIAAAPWDLVIVDEAHHARRYFGGETNKGYDLLTDLRDRVNGMLLLTATPMQLHDYELYSMIELVSPGLFSSYEDFAGASEDLGEFNEHMAWLRLPAGPHDRKQDLYRLLRSSDAPDEIVIADPSEPEGRARLIAWLERRHRMSEALVRNRKAEVGGFTQRVARRITVEPTAQELELEEAVHEYIGRQYALSPAKALVLVTFRKILASSTEALAAAFRRRAARLRGGVLETESEISDDPDVSEEVLKALREESLDAEAEIIELDALADMAESAPDSKLAGLERALDDVFAADPTQKVLIFTQFIGTLEMLKKRLEDRYRVEVFHGGMSTGEKDAAHRRFQGNSQIMLSSEAGGEGRNFQFCHILVNYDLPWNPMRVEQRIGRLDRVGQKHDVIVHNFSLEGTLDQRILDVLENRIEVFKATVGGLDPILGDIEKRIEEIILKEPSVAEEEFTRFALDLDTRLHQARQQEENMRDFILDARSFRRDEVQKLLETQPVATPKELERFVRTALAPYPTARIETQEDGALEITLPPRLLERAHQQRGRRLKDSYRGTFDTQTAVREEHVDFFAFGHPMVEALMDIFAEPDSVALPAIRVDSSCPTGVIFDYRVRFNGVRGKDWVLSHLVTQDSVIETPAVDAPGKGKIAFDPTTLGERIDEMAQRSRSAAERVISTEFEAFEAANDALYSEERRRLERLFDFQVRFFSQRITTNETMVGIYKTFGSDAEKRTIPLREGQIRKDRERIGRIDEERASRLETLERKRSTSRELAPVGRTALIRTPSESSAGPQSTASRG